MQKEILEYFKMIKGTKYVKVQKKLTKSKEETLKGYSLSIMHPIFTII